MPCFTKSSILLFYKTSTTALRIDIALKTFIRNLREFISNYMVTIQ